MADLEDVIAVLATKCAVSVYPKGLAMPSVAGVPIKVVQGWPDSSDLNQYLSVGNVQVSVYPLPMERVTTRYQPVWQQVDAPAAPSITLSVVDNTITVGGSVPVPFVPHNLAVLIDGAGFLYSVQPTDTQKLIATGLAAAIARAYPLTTNQNSTITVNGAFLGLRNDQTVEDAAGDPVVVARQPAPIVARVGTVGTSIREVRRQKRLYQITVWAPTPDKRRAVATALDIALQKCAFLTMPDGTAARVEYFDSPMTDMLSKGNLYRRDLRYWVEYATTEQQENATVIIGRIMNQDPVTGTNLSITDY